ncbi:MAG TPA: hypothetical protein VER76_01080, partial [Pyrinomonadaceae bacterium]|nr:hypothetical protein [Pyrinomonadaceae bacterium]
MTNLRTRAFLPAVFIQFVLALAITQHAFSQEPQTAPPPQTQKTETPAEKALTKDETCEQSPTAATPESAGVEQRDASKVVAFASQTANLTSPRDLNIAAARSLTFDASTRVSSKLFADSALSGVQQTGAAATFTPKTSEQKMRRAFKSAFLSPEAYAVPFLSAVITEVGED